MEEVAEIRDLANRLAAWIDCGAKRPDNRNLVLKVAVLVCRRKLSRDDYEQLLESFEHRAAQRDLPDRPGGWAYNVLSNRCGSQRAFEKLLATTDVPSELMQRQTAPKTSEATDA